MSVHVERCREWLKAHRNFALRAVPFALAMLGLGMLSSACSNDPPRPPAKDASAGGGRAPRNAVVEEANALEATSAIRVALTSLRGTQLYIPPWFSAKQGGYDLIVHFHGLGKIQEANIERAQLNVAVVSINLGAGTTPYAKPFQRHEVFEEILEEAQAEIEKSGRAPNAKLRRLALSAWSAGYVSIAAVMKNPNVAQRVDAVLLADGFFTSFTNLRKRTVNEHGIEPFARFAEAAERDEKLFAITHTTIPTGNFPSVQECVDKLLEMTALGKVPSSAVGPREMHEIYLVDRGSFHVRGYEGRTAKAHVLQIQAMGETLYPYLKARWDKQDQVAAAPPPSSPR